MMLSMFCMLKVRKYILLTFQNIKRLSALLRGIPSKCNGDFYCFNCFYSFRTKNKLGSHKKVYRNKDSCNVIMPYENTKILDFSQYRKNIIYYLYLP